MPALTPHNSAKAGDFAKTVLMPGDPLRSKFIAETFLEDVVMVNNIRGIHGYTGTYKGIRVSVMASGMGMPSIGIYSYELFKFYGVSNIMRIGSAGALTDKLKIRDLVAGMGACTNSNFSHQYGLPGAFAPIASYRMLRTLMDTADDLGISVTPGNILSSDIFYDDDPAIYKEWAKMGVLCTEMESAALYMNAARLGKNALTIVTISDNLVTKEEIAPEERQTSFTQMMEVALNTAVKLDPM